MSEYTKLGDEVRKQGYERNKSMYDLVYNETTGMFEIPTEPTTSGIVVTEMTREGFA
ncbi:MAG: hypothetical protein IJU90_07250 [Bacteroidales bacterium]|nr:hypothetical protein [Bacteroidales bacterium]